jgi:hypothetical protein
VDSVLLDHDYVFADGIYDNFAALRQNRPSRPWTAVPTQGVVRLQDDFRIQFETRSPQSTAMAEVYAVVVDGLPYLRGRREKQRAFVEFAGLRVRGRLCYLAYDTLVTKTFEVKAYNPATGRPFRKGNVTRTERQAVERVLDFRTGKLYPLNRSNLLRLVADDPEISRAIEVIPNNAELADALFRALKIYDERHPLWMPRTSTQ